MDPSNESISSEGVDTSTPVDDGFLYTGACHDEPGQSEGCNTLQPSESSESVPFGRTSDAVFSHIDYCRFGEALQCENGDITFQLASADARHSPPFSTRDLQPFDTLGGSVPTAGTSDARYSDDMEAFFDYDLYALNGHGPQYCLRPRISQSVDGTFGNDDQSFSCYGNQRVGVQQALPTMGLTTGLTGISPAKAPDGKFRIYPARTIPQCSQCNESFTSHALYQ